MSEAMPPQELERLRNLELRGTSYTVAGYKALLAEVDRLTTALAELEELGTEAYAEKLLGQARLRSMEIRSGSFEMDLTEAQEMAAAYVAMCRTMLGDAENYTETPVGFPTAKTEFTVKIAESPVDWYVLTVQRKWKLTPHEARQRAEADRDQARARVAELEAAHQFCDGALQLQRNKIARLETRLQRHAAAPDRSDGSGPMPLDEAFDELRQLPGFPGWHDADGSGQ